MRSVTYVAALAAPFALAASAIAQPGELSPGVAQELVVGVQTISLDSEGNPEPALFASGTVFGQRRDTLYIATSRHQLQDAVVAYVQLAPGSRYWLQAEIQWLDADVDVAVLAMTSHVTDQAWKEPRVVPRPSRRIEIGERVFALGCPQGRCWAWPEQGTLAGYEEPHLVIRDLYLKPGNSGGPLVDADGSLIGIILARDAAVEGEAAWWPVVEEVLRRHGYPVNLAPLRGHRLGQLSLRVAGAVFPGAGVNSDGRRLQRGWRAEMALRVYPGFEVVGGVNRVSFAASPYADLEVDWEEAYAHLFVFAGGRFSVPLTGRSLGRALPDIVSFGVDALLPMKQHTLMVSLAASDSVDLARGEFVRVRSVVQSRAGLSFAYRLSYRVALSRRTAVFVTPSMYLMNFKHLETSPFRGFVEIGAEALLSKW